MILKLMSGEDLPDGNTHKTFRLWGDIRRVDFYRQVDNGCPCAYIEFRDGSTHSPCLDGNAYVMDDSGKTIESFAHAPGWPTQKDQKDA